MPIYKVTRSGTYWDCSTVLAKNQEDAESKVSESENVISDEDTDYGDWDGEEEIELDEGEEIDCTCDTDNGQTCAKCEEYYEELKREFPAKYQDKDTPYNPFT